MLFKQRLSPKWSEKTRVLLWPRRSWSRSVRYFLKRLFRLSASSHAIAAGFSAGVFASFTPFLGLHTIIACVIAYIIAGNLIAATIGTFFGNPLTFPFIWASTFHTGNFFLSSSKAEVSDTIYFSEILKNLRPHEIFKLETSEVFTRIFYLWEPIILPMSIGAVLVGIVFSVGVYILIRITYLKLSKIKNRKHI